MKLSPLLRQFWSTLISYVAIALITAVLCSISFGWIVACLAFSLFMVVLTYRLNNLGIVQELGCARTQEIL
jgi:hypothetical protein